MNDTLTRFGLTENEEKVYVGIYQNPLSTGAAIARKLHMDKSSAYKAVDGLQDKGLVLVSDGKNGWVYEAVAAQTLRDLYTNQKLQLEQDNQKLEQFIGRLQTGENNRQISLVVEKGFGVFKRRMTESLDCKEKLIRERWGYHPFTVRPEYVAFVTEYAHLRINRGIFLQELDMELEQIHSVYKGFLKDSKKSLKEVRSQAGEMADKNFLRIWDNTINILSFDGNGDFVVVTIKDQYLSSMMKNLYDFVWERSEVKKGMVE